jgi:selenocysteine lyase/cysteine desulfurase
VAAAFCFSLNATLIVASKSIRSSWRSGAAPACQAHARRSRPCRPEPGQNAAHRAGPAAATRSASTSQARTALPYCPPIRFSPHYYNTESEIDRTTELVAGLAM